MPRKSRVKSKSGYYHVMLRGNEKKNIFNNDDDKKRFIEILAENKLDGKFYLTAFCLMSNHVHLMIKEGNEDLSSSIKRIAGTYVSYFNKKYDRTGHLFQDRFRSEPVEDESYVIALVRYIHQNPVKAGLVKKISDYKWSSYSCYLSDDDEMCQIVDTDLILGIFSDDKKKAIEQFKNYMEQTEGTEVFIDIEEEKMSTEEAKELFKKMAMEFGIKDIENLEIKKRKEWHDLIKKYREKTGLSIKDIASIAGVTRYSIHKILKEKGNA